MYMLDGDSTKRRVQNLDRMQRDAAGGVFQLMAATRARGSNQRVRRRGAHGREEHELADLLRYLEMLILITE